MSIEVFMGGAKKGFYIGIEQILPAMILGYVIVQFLQLTGLVDILGRVFGPIDKTTSPCYNNTKKLSGPTEESYGEIYDYYNIEIIVEGEHGAVLDKATKAKGKNEIIWQE